MRLPSVRSTKNRARVLPLITAVTLTCLSLTLNPQSAIAHQVEIVEDIGATLHIEPNDTPRAGEEVLAWFALTRRGGETIPLSACNCELTVRKRANQPANVQTNDSATPASPPNLTPTLEAVATEGYQGIPGATFTFPEVGVYTLAISGTPKQADSFNAFELTFDVTVAAGQAVPQIPVDERATLPSPQDATAQLPADNSSEPLASPQRPLWIVLGVSAVGLIGIIGWVIQRSQPKS